MFRVCISSQRVSRPSDGVQRSTLRRRTLGRSWPCMSPETARLESPSVQSNAIEDSRTPPVGSLHVAARSGGDGGCGGGAAGSISVYGSPASVHEPTSKSKNLAFQQNPGMMTELSSYLW